MIRGYGIKLIECHYSDILETHPSLLIALHQFAVESEGSLSCSESQEERSCVAMSIDSVHNLIGYMLNACILCFEYFSRDFFISAIDVARNACSDESTILRQCILTFHRCIIILKVVTVFWVKGRKRL
jgi:hypothetical protein